MRTTERTRRRRWGTARRITAITVVTANHGGHGRSRRSLPVTAVTAGHGGHGQLRPNVSDGGHGPCFTTQARTALVRVRTAPSRHDLSTAVTAVVTAAAAPPGSRIGAPGAAPTRSSARLQVNGEPGLRSGDRRTAAGEGTTRAGWRVKQNEREHLHAATSFVECLVLKSRGSCREIRYFEFALSATNRHGPALNCPAGSRPSGQTNGLTWCGPILPNLGRPD